MKNIKVDPSKWISGKGYKKQILASPDDLDSGGTLAQIVEIEAGSVVEDHYHKETYEFYHVIEGEVTFEINGEVTKLKQGDMMITEPGDVHSVRNESERLFRILVFKTNVVEDDIYWK